MKTQTPLLVGSTRMFKAFPFYPFSAYKLCKIDGSDIKNTNGLFQTMSSLMDDGENSSQPICMTDWCTREYPCVPLSVRITLICEMLPINLLENNMVAHQFSTRCDLRVIKELI